MRSHPEIQEAVPSAADITAQLEAILACQSFQDSPGLATFLTFIVNETLAGRAGRIKGFNIAQEVFDRKDPEDAQTSTIVRVEARRLRAKLEAFYSRDQPEGGVLIEVPVGTYVPNFSFRQVAQSGSGKNVQDRSGQGELGYRSPLKRGASKRFTVFIAAASLFAISMYLFNMLVTGAGETVQQNDPRAPGMLESQPSIAVMPFVNKMDDRPRGQTLSYGLTEDIITDLSRLTAIDVVAFPSVAVLGSEADLETIASQLNVTHVLHGSIRGTPEHARITAQLFETGTNSHIWAERYDREVQNFLNLEDELARKIAKSLSSNLDLSALTKAPYEWKNAGSSALFSQALQLVNPPVNPARLIASRAEFEHLAEREPEFAGGYAGVAYTSAFMAYWRHDDAWMQYAEEAIEYANKAIELDENFALAYSALAFAQLANGEFDRALSLSSIGIGKQPNDPYANAYHGIILAANGQAELGISFLDHALSLDPLNPRTPFLNMLGFLQLFVNEPGESLESLQRSLTRGGPVSSSNSIHRAIALILLGQKDQAAKLIQDVENMDTHFGLQSWQDWINRSVRFSEDRDKLFKPLERAGLL